MLMNGLVVVACVMAAAVALPSGKEHAKFGGKETKRKERDYHPIFKSSGDISIAVNPAENNATFWNVKAINSLNERLNIQPNQNIAKNVILFLGDGMSVPTLAATRLYLRSNENAELSFEKFPHTAVSKTYCVDKQVADSACTSTAYLTGVKANYGTLGVTGAVPRGDCDQMNDQANHVFSIAAWAQAKGKSTGIVTTSTVTDASPAGAYAHTADRVWQVDSNIPEACRNTTTDIATQLVKGDVGKNFNVILGGGLKKFIPTPGGDRTDNIDLTQEWINDKQDEKAQLIYTKDALLNLANDTEFVFGLFTDDTFPYNIENEAYYYPSLEEMTEAAIKVASQNENGYFLFIEGGLIDHGHHDTRALVALDETSEFSEAIQRAVEMTDEQDTLIVVTSDHSHTMSFSGYPNRGSDPLGLAGNADDNLPYRTLSYANGPGYRPEVDGHRHDVSTDTVNKGYEFPAGAPLGAETHGGDDVLIFARGPWSHLFNGVVEQNTIPHYMAYAACVGDGPVACDGAFAKREI